MHPFYGPSARLLADRGASASGLASMAAYLAFWAAALLLVKREVDARFPRDRRSPAGDRALELLRERFARGEIDETRFRAMAEVLSQIREIPEPG